MNKHYIILFENKFKCYACTYYWFLVYKDVRHHITFSFKCFSKLITLIHNTNWYKPEWQFHSYKVTITHSYSLSNTFSGITELSALKIFQFVCKMVILTICTNNWELFSLIMKLLLEIITKLCEHLIISKWITKSENNGYEKLTFSRKLIY